jgi:hypothetical protein
VRQQPFTSPEEALKHHGVKGQKWGVQKKEELVGRDASGKVTPDTSKPALSEKNQRRIEKFQKRAYVMNTRISELKVSNEALQGTKNPAKQYARYVNNQDIKNLEKTQKRAVRDAEAVQKGKLTSTQKKVIIGAVGVSAIIAAGAIYQGQQSGALNSTMLRGSAFLRGEKIPFATNPKLSGHMSANELLTHVAKPVNPGYSKAGGKMNCRRSTYAYELRRRGFDVHATTSAVGWGQSESGVINAVTPGSRNFYRSRSVSQAVVETGASSVARGDKRVNPIKKILLDNLDASKPLGQYTGYISNSQRVLEELGKQPNGARGEVLFKFPQFGHSMAYEIVDGKPHIFDSQKGTLYNAATKMVESKWDGFTGAEITRLDNADLDLNFLTRWATNVGD